MLRLARPRWRAFRQDKLKQEGLWSPIRGSRRCCSTRAPSIPTPRRLRTIRNLYPMRPAGMLGDFSICAMPGIRRAEFSPGSRRPINRYCDGVIPPTRFMFSTPIAIPASACSGATTLSGLVHFARAEARASPEKPSVPLFPAIIFLGPLVAQGHRRVVPGVLHRLQPRPQRPPGRQDPSFTK